LAARRGQEQVEEIALRVRPIGNVARQLDAGIRLGAVILLVELHRGAEILGRDLDADGADLFAHLGEVQGRLAGGVGHVSLPTESNQTLSNSSATVGNTRI